MPAPVYLQIQNLKNLRCKNNKIKLQQLEENELNLMKGLEVNKQGELKIIDEKIQNKFKGLMSELIKKITSSIAEGKGMVGVCMPIRVFEPRSMIDRITGCWAYAVQYLSNRLHSHSNLSFKQKVENMENVITFALSGLHMQLSVLKPFNPLEGETYEGVFSDGSKLSIEHISHHPPISYFYLDSDKFILYGYYEYKAKTSSNFNSITIDYAGPNTIIIKNNNQKIIYNMPSVLMSGLIWGDRLIKYKNHMIFQDSINQIKAAISFGIQKIGNKFSDKRADYFYGKIYYYEQSKILKEDEILKTPDLIKQLSEIQGNYFNNVIINGQVVWDINVNIKSPVVPIQNPLPSDWRFREDLIWLIYHDLTKSEKWKLRLEEEQRHFKNLRQQFKKLNKQYFKK